MSSDLNVEEGYRVEVGHARTRSARVGVTIPQVSRFMLGGFKWYIAGYLRRHFNAVRVAIPEPIPFATNESVVCFANHPSWWDPLLAFLLNETYLPGRTLYAPIDETALKQYPVFGKLGFYGIELESLEGAKRFLAVTRALLSQPDAAIWMTPSGQFEDVRSPPNFKAGLGHVAAKAGRVVFVPVAFEYTFWEERTPEALVEFGEPVRPSDRGQSKEQWQIELEARLAAAQRSLANKAISRDPDQFQTVMDGSAGVGGWYDHWRRLKAIVARQPFDPRHSRLTRKTDD